jgi:hypothetical protein
LHLISAARYVLVYASEGCQPQNRLFYLDLTQVPARADGALDFSSFDFFKGEAAAADCDNFV